MCNNKPIPTLFIRIYDINDKFLGEERIENHKASSEEIFGFFYKNEKYNNAHYYRKI